MSNTLYTKILSRELGGRLTPRKRAIWERLYNHAHKHQSPLAYAFANLFYPGSTEEADPPSYDYRY